MTTPVYFFLWKINSPRPQSWGSLLAGGDPRGHTRLRLARSLVKLNPFGTVVNVSCPLPPTAPYAPASIDNRSSLTTSHYSNSRSRSSHARSNLVLRSSSNSLNFSNTVCPLLIVKLSQYRSNLSLLPPISFLNFF